MNAAKLHLFFDEYASAFARYDAQALADLFAFPLHVVSDTEDITPTSIPNRDGWLGVLRWLLDAYRALGVAGSEPLALDLTEVTPRLASVRAHWELRRQDGSRIYDFMAIYTLAQVGEAWRIAAVAHDEVPKLRSAMAAR